MYVPVHIQYADLMFLSLSSNTKFVTMLYTSSPELRDENREYMNHKDFSETLTGKIAPNVEVRGAPLFRFRFYSEGKHRHI